MPRRINSSQLRSKLRQLEQKQRRALNDLNREINRINSANRRAAAEAKRAIDKYNRDVNARNARARASRRKLANEIRRLNSRPRQTVTVRYTTYRTSVQTLHRSFTHLEQAAETGTWATDYDLLGMAEDETANSVAALNALLDEPATEDADDEELRETVITTELHEISEDLDARWRGALFSLNPMNPDAARHFCTSCREILVKILDLKAPDKAVRAANPNVELTPNGQVLRREKIYYCLTQRGYMSDELADFVENDINNVMELFGAFNPATHGEAGRYDLVQLRALKTRVEGAIQFLHRIVNG